MNLTAKSFKMSFNQYNSFIPHCALPESIIFYYNVEELK